MMSGWVGEDIGRFWWYQPVSGGFGWFGVGSGFINYESATYFRPVTSGHNYSLYNSIYISVLNNFIC